VDALGWLIFLVALLVSVMLHESGHFVAAKRFGMKCTRYFVGFGPTIWSTWRGETEYGIKALPLGGFVKIVGMTSMDEVEPEDEERSFRRAPGWQRLIVLSAGSFMHFVIAAVLLFGLALTIGAESQGCTTAQSPAQHAGLQVGDQVTSFDGTQVSSWTQLSNDIVKAKPGVPVTLTVLRAGQPLTLHTALAEVPGHGSYLGIAPASASSTKLGTVSTCVPENEQALVNGIVFQRQNVFGAVKYVGTGFSQVITGSVSALGKLPAAVPSLFAKDRSSTAAGSVSSVVGAARETGQAVAANVAWQNKVSFVLLLIASLNIFVGVFNMLPLLPMDGGHVAVVIWERIKAWFARLRGRPDPGMVDYRKLVPLSFGIFLVLVVFGTMLILADIVNPVNIG
jgi:membrane-associated protease RseP (regulator of RpoE activity)